MTRKPSPAVKNIGGAYSLGRLSVPLNVLGLIYLVFIAITCNFPTRPPVSPGNMNYTSVAVSIHHGHRGCNVGQHRSKTIPWPSVMFVEEVVGIQPSTAVEVASQEQIKAEKQRSSERCSCSLWLPFSWPRLLFELRKLLSPPRL
jgi:hypothetical protein